MERRAQTRIGPSAVGMRLISWLALNFRYADSGRWREFCQSGELRLNGERAQGDEVLELGDSVEFMPQGIEEPPARLSFGLLHEDENYLILDKAAPLSCHPGGAFFKHSLWHLLKESGRQEFYFASRLDRESSGAICICKTARALAHWNAAQAEVQSDSEGRKIPAIKKSYLALVHGRFPAELEARGSLVPDKESAVRKKLRFIPGGTEGQAVLTRFRSLAKHGGMSLVEAQLLSGRTHQIRASLLGLGFPLVGDKLYGLDEGIFLRFAQGDLSATDREDLILERQALHSWRLGFRSIDGSWINCQAPLPPEFQALLPPGFQLDSRTLESSEPQKQFSANPA